MLPQMPHYPKAYHQTDQMIIAHVKARPTFSRAKTAQKYFSLWRAFVWLLDSGTVGIFWLVYCIRWRDIVCTVGVNHDAS